MSKTKDIDKEKLSLDYLFDQGINFVDRIIQINEEIDKGILLAKAYVEGNFEIAAKYMAEDAINLVNGVEYSKDDWIAGYKRDQEVFDNIQHNNDNITTMYYNNGRIFTNHWLTWSGTSKITGESNEVEYYGYWEWKDTNENN